MSPGPRRRRALVIVALAIVGTLGATTPVDAQSAGPVGSTPGSTPGSTQGTLRTPVLSVRRAPDFLRAPAADAALTASLTDLVQEAPADTCLVVSDHGRDVLAVQPDLPVMPASLLKLVTMDTALDVLGPDTTLDTVIKTDAAPAPGGVVAGNLYLIGGGDPLLFTEGFRVTLKDEHQPQTDFAGVADAIAAAGITRIDGGVVGDDSRYDAERAVSTWSPGYQAEGAAGALSALEVNRGQTGLAADPDTPAKVRKLGDPPSLAAETLVSLLEDRGVTVGGAASAGVTPPNAVEVLRVPSLPMAALAGEVLTWSDNTAAELVTKEIGLRTAGAGTTAAGTAAVTEHLAEQGLPTEGVTIVDGSGLDRGNRVTCRLVAELLDEVGSDSVLAEGLSVAGESGTLGQRLRGSRLQGRLRAKTGTLSDVDALAGYLTTDGGSELTFAVIANGGDGEEYQLLDDMALTMLAYPQAPARELLGPR